jgi:hypothetical protein
MTDAVFAAGSCKTIAHAKEIGNAAGCGNTFTNGVRVGACRAWMRNRA